MTEMDDSSQPGLALLETAIHAPTDSGQGDRGPETKPRVPSDVVHPQQRSGRMQRIKVLDERLWPDVPPDVIKEAEAAADWDTAWIARQGNGHIVVMDAPGDPDVATGDLLFIAEVAPKRP